MPKNEEEYEDADEGDDDEAIVDDDELEGNEGNEVPSAHKSKISSKYLSPSAKAELRKEEDKIRPKLGPRKEVPKERFAYVASPQIEAIMDNETKELIATNVWEAMANIIGRLERIENMIGSFGSR